MRQEAITTVCRDIDELNEDRSNAGLSESCNKYFFPFPKCPQKDNYVIG